MFTVYIVRSRASGKYYVGHTEDMEQRMVEHNKGMSKYTRGGRPWELTYSEQLRTRGEAMAREREIKGRKSRQYLERLIRGA